MRRALLLGTALAAPLSAAQAQSAAPPAATAAAETGEGLDEIVVTASKRSESLQKVPISITVLGNEKLDQLQVKAFNDYVRFLPSVTYQTGGPGSARVYFRGVSSGENGNHSSSQPTVGQYLDEQPITTIGRARSRSTSTTSRGSRRSPGRRARSTAARQRGGHDPHHHQQARSVEILRLRDFEVNKVTDGGWGYVGEAYVNVPLSDKIAVRAVGWYDKDAGYIDNILQTRTFPVSGITQTTAPFVKKNYNDVETYGGRVALGIELDDNWTITPALMGQKQSSDGFYGQESGLKKRQVAQYNPETNQDDWWQAALTIEGKLGDWSLTYAGAYLKRSIDAQLDYSDYSYFYDALNGSGAYIYRQRRQSDQSEPAHRFQPAVHQAEPRIPHHSPADKSLRLIAGAFYQRQKNGIEENYIIDNIAGVEPCARACPTLPSPAPPSNIWLTKQTRVDRDYAIFGELAYDIFDNLTLTGGARVYRYDNSLVGFFGYAAGYSSRTGESACFAGPIVSGTTCTNLNRRTKKTDWLPKVNLTWKVTDDKLVYFTYSKGFRPGGINRRGTLEPYQPDTLDNFELGFKTQWLDNRLRVNGAIYQENWNKVQFSSLGENGLTVIRNAGNARIRGVEFDINVVPVTGLTLSARRQLQRCQADHRFLQLPDQFGLNDCTIPGPGGRPQLRAGAGRARACPTPPGSRATPSRAMTSPSRTASTRISRRGGAGGQADAATCGPTSGGSSAISRPIPPSTLSAGIKTGRYSAELCTSPT